VERNLNGTRRAGIKRRDEDAAAEQRGRDVVGMTLELDRPREELLARRALGRELCAEQQTGRDGGAPSCPGRARGDLRVGGELDARVPPKRS
jgi:hypothetical protein